MTTIVVLSEDQHTMGPSADGLIKDMVVLLGGKESDLTRKGLLRHWAIRQLNACGP